MLTFLIFMLVLPPKGSHAYERFVAQSAENILAPTYQSACAAKAEDRNIGVVAVDTDGMNVLWVESG